MVGHPSLTKDLQLGHRYPAVMGFGGWCWQAVLTDVDCTLTVRCRHPALQGR